VALTVPFVHVPSGKMHTGAWRGSLARSQIALSVAVRESLLMRSTNIVCIALQTVPINGIFSTPFLATVDGANK
jgi:hypothetical protein